MSKKKFLLKNYLEPIALSDIEQEEEYDSFLLDKNVSGPYPFTKKSLIKYLGSEAFLSSFVEISKKEEIENKGEKLSLKQKMENISFEKKQEEIKFEKRKRYQAYQMLDYTLSNFTYFDFFSADGFQIAKNSKYIAQLYGKQRVTLDMLFLPFFDAQFPIGDLLNSFGFNETFLEKFSEQIKLVKEEENFLFSIFHRIQNKWNNVSQLIFPSEDNKLIFNQHIRYSYQVHQIFEKSAENALNRFKTPVITPEILLITLMEEKNSMIGHLIKKNITDETNWYLLRYKLIKRLFSQESNIRSQVKKNQQFFAYMLKTELPDSSFEKLIKKNLLGKAVCLFRNTVISELLQSDLFESFEDEIHASLSTAPKRHYSR